MIDPDIMDLTVLIVIGVFAIAILMYLISAFIMREKPFEKVMEDQRIPSDLLEPEPSPKPEKKRKHVRVKKGDKPASSDDVVSAAHTMLTVRKSPSKKSVGLELEPEIIDVDDDDDIRHPETPEKKPVTPSTPPAKSILLNKDERSAVRKTVTVPETFHARHAPVDEVEQKQERRRSELALLEIEQVAEKNAAQVAPVAARGEKKKKQKGQPSTAVDEVLEVCLLSGSALASGVSSEMANNVCKK